MSFSFVILMKKLVPNFIGPNFVPMFLWYPEVSYFLVAILSIDGRPVAQYHLQKEYYCILLCWVQMVDLSKWKCNDNICPLVDRDVARKVRLMWFQDNCWDVISPSTTLPANIKYVVVDVETHDWNDSNTTDHSCSRIVEIAWGLYDENERYLGYKQYLLKPHGYGDIAVKATQAHGITTSCAIKHGSDASLVLDEFISIIQSIPKDGFVVAHNMRHEHLILMHNLCSEEHKMIWDNVPKCDTNNKILLKYVTCFKRGYKQMKCRGVRLSVLHQKIHPSSKLTLLDAKVALTDVKMTWDIFQFYSKCASHEELTWRESKGFLASDFKPRKRDREE